MTRKATAPIEIPALNRATRRRDARVTLTPPPTPIRVLDAAQRLGIQAALTELGATRQRLADVEAAVATVFHSVGLDPARDYPMNPQTGEVYEPGTILG